MNAGENIIDLALEYNNSQLAEGETPEERLEDKYYDQFAAMESAMAAMQSQQSYISALMGTA